MRVGAGCVGRFQHAISPAGARVHEQLAAFMEELRHGFLSAEDLREWRLQGKFAMPLHIFTDSYSIFSYLKAAHLKFPAEKSTYIHLAFIKECLDVGALCSLTWIDTRDMVVDGMTKGLAGRAPL